MTTLQNIERLIGKLNEAAEANGENPTCRTNDAAIKAHAALMSAIASAVQDAKRYRWLRHEGALKRAAHIAVLTRNGGYVAEEEVADAAIDAALAQSQQGVEL